MTRLIAIDDDDDDDDDGRLNVTSDAPVRRREATATLSRETVQESIRIR